jgi:hypothetical protein
MITKIFKGVFAGLAVMAMVACVASEGPPVEGEWAGKIRVAFQSPPDSELNDVTGVHFKVVEPAQQCTASAIAEATVELEDEALPIDLLPEDLRVEGAGSRSFADSLFVLEPGEYKVCGIPMAGQSPSEMCSEASQSATVFEGSTTEIMLLMQCECEGAGAIDVIAQLNDCPSIDDLEIEPSKFVGVCERAMITVSASDGNGDELAYEWSVVTLPEGEGEGKYTLRPDENKAGFRASLPGRYELKVTVSDINGAGSSLTFPIYVSGEAAPCNGEDSE